MNGNIHGLRTPNEGINQRNLKFWADVADKICFGRIYKFGIGIWFSAVQWRRFPHRASVVRGFYYNFVVWKGKKFYLSNSPWLVILSTYYAVFLAYKVNISKKILIWSFFVLENIRCINCNKCTVIRFSWITIFVIWLEFYVQLEMCIKSNPYDDTKKMIY